MVEQLDHFDDLTSKWEQLVVEGRHSTPADVAATRVDFRATWPVASPVARVSATRLVCSGNDSSHARKSIRVDAT
jgi:hypothetical protein